MKLYAVRIEIETVIMANTQEEAESKADEVISEGSEPHYAVAREITKRADFPTGWNGSEIPWGQEDEGQDSLNDIFSANVESIHPETKP
jgi:putative aminopeptidase FrvX